MALQVSLTLPPVRMPESPGEEPVGGAAYPEAYARLSFVRIDAKMAYPLVVWYASRAARDRGDAPVHLHEFGTATEGLVGSIYPAAYTWLKTLPEFSGATDC